MVIVDYLTFLKENHLDAVALENVRLYETKNIPLLRFFPQLKQAELLESTKKGLVKLITDFEENKQYDTLAESIKKWINDENIGFRRDQVKIDDLINIYGSIKEALIHFIGFYTSDVATCIKIVQECEEYFAEAHRLTTETLIHISNEELKGNEKKYRLLADNSLDLIATLSFQGTITYMSPSCKLVLGYEPEEMEGHDKTDFLHPEDLEIFRAKRNTLLTQKVTETFTLRMKRKDGIYIWFELNAKNIPSPKGSEVPEILTSARNISARKIAEDGLKQKETMLIESQRIAKIGSWEWNVKTNDLIWSAQHYAIYGMDQKNGNIRHEVAILMRHPEDSAKTQEKIKAAIENHTPLNFDHRIIVNGAVKVVNVIGEVVYDKNGDITLRGTSQDITHIWEIQQQMIQNNRQLGEAQQVAHLGFWEWDTREDTVYWSDEMYRIFGYEPQSVPMNPDLYISHIFPADKEIVQDVISDCYLDGKPYTFENRIVTKDGRIRWLYATGRVMEKKNGKNIKLSGIAFDITDRKNASIELNDKIRELERSNNDLQTYASIASHDLKEPLRKIKINANVLLENYGQELIPGTDKYLQRIVSSAHRMEKLIEDVLSVSKISGKKTNLELTDLNLIIQQCLYDQDAVIKNKQATIEVAELPRLMVDQVQIHQLFQNLISNSLKFSREDETPHITISSSLGVPPNHKKEELRYENYCNIALTDNGIGFSQQFVDKVFIMFQRLHEKGKYEGNGIGLAICKKIVENHEGFIEAFGETNKGTTFIISLPLRTFIYNSKNQ